MILRGAAIFVPFLGVLAAFAAWVDLWEATWRAAGRADQLSPSKVGSFVLLTAASPFENASDRLVQTSPGNSPRRGIF